MQRKLIPQGLGGYTIYLPKKWITKKGLQKDDAVTIIETGPDLVIQTTKQQKKTITIDLDDITEAWNVRVLLLHAYRKDYDRITLTSKEPLDLDHLQGIVNDLLLGCAITTKQANKVVIENISEPTGEKYDAILRRVFLLNKETINEMKGWTDGTSATIKDYRDQLDKYVLFCKRILYKDRYHHDPLVHWELLTFLMHINHALYYLADYLRQHAMRKETRQLIELLDDYYDLLYKAYYKKDYGYVKTINERRHDYQFGKLIALLEQKTDDAVVIAYLKEAFRLIQIGTSPVVALLLEELYTD